MKYESNILKRLIDTYGVIGNPRYLSEIIKEFIVRGKELYPHLFTYQADWLAHIDEFGLTPDYVVSYTGQQIYAPHTKERPVKRAILKGNTGYRDIDTGEILETFEEGRNLELVSVKMPVLTTTGKNLFDINDNFELGYIDQTGEISLTNRSNSFERKNNGFSVNVTSSYGGVVSSYITVKPNTSYKISFNKIGSFTTQANIIFFDNNKNVIKNIMDNRLVDSFTTPSSCSYLRIGFWLFNVPNTIVYENIQLEEGTQATPYEPYKSNILTVNEDVELRGIGDVKDELNLLTGEVIERIGEIVFDGTQNKDNWGTANNENENFIQFYWVDTLVATDNGGNDIKVNCNRFPVYSPNSLISTNPQKIGVSSRRNGGQGLVFSLSKTDIPSFSGDSINSYFAQNPTTVQYQLATPTIKSVDLTILDQNGQNVKQLMSFNGGTHFTTSSQDGSLLPTLTVDVVTNLEETLKVCSLEGNTV